MKSVKQAELPEWFPRDALGAVSKLCEVEATGPFERVRKNERIIAWAQAAVQFAESKRPTEERFPDPVERAHQEADFAATVKTVVAQQAAEWVRRLRTFASREAQNPSAYLAVSLRAGPCNGGYLVPGYGKARRGGAA